MFEVSMNRKYMVMVLCLTYNHELYLEDALKGFVMQKTNFPFIAVVIDDCSTDGTANILHRYEEMYPDIIKAVYLPENYYSQGKSKYPFYREYQENSKYIALCEGDDYWTDPLKLQKQVDFLECHSDYSMCFHAADYLRGTAIVGNDRHFENDCEVSSDQIIAGGGLYCATASLVYKNGIIKEIPQWRKMADVGDYPLQIQLSLLGRVWGFSRVMSVYRTGHAGSWMQNHSFDLQHFETEIKWLKVLDHYTKRKYQRSIYQRIIMFSIPLCRARQLSSFDLLCRYGKLSSQNKKKFMKPVIKAVIYNISPKLYRIIAGE